MIAERDGQLWVSGDVNQSTVAKLLPQGEALVREADRVVNLGQIEAVDSAAVALLLGWLRAARAAGRKLVIADAPPAFVSLASLYGVTPMLFPDAGSALQDQH